MAWAFVALTYIAAGGVIASLLHQEGQGKREYLFWMLAWPILYVGAIVQGERQ